MFQYLLFLCKMRAPPAAERLKLNFSENLQNWVEDKSILSISFSYIVCIFHPSFLLCFRFFCVLLIEWKNVVGWTRHKRFEIQGRCVKCWVKSWKEFNMWKRKKKPEIAWKMWKKENSTQTSTRFSKNGKFLISFLLVSSLMLRHINQMLEGRRFLVVISSSQLRGKNKKTKLFF